MSFAYLRLYTGDYLKDTRHLTPMKHGIYLMMLMHCWDQKGPLPLDRDELAGICNARSGDEMAAIDYILGRYFIKTDDGYYNKRMDGEIAEANVYAEKQREKGRKGGLSKGKQAGAKQRLSNGQATAKQKLSPSASASASASASTSTSTSRSARGTRIAVATLPSAWESYCREKRADLDPAETFDKFRDYYLSVVGSKGLKLDWDATWRSWVRNERKQKDGGGGYDWLQAAKDADEKVIDVEATEKW